MLTRSTGFALAALTALAVVSSSRPAAAVEVITWVPPYAMAECRSMAEADFGACDPRDGLTRVGLQFWVPQPDGTVKYADHEWSVPDDAEVAWWRAWCRANGVECFLTIYNNIGTWDWPLARSAFADNRATFVAALVAELERHDLDGIDLDLEGVGDFEGDRAAFALFVSELSTELGARGKLLTIDTFHYIWNAPNHSWWPDWVGEVENVHSMGYQDLYEGAPDWQRYSYQQATGVAAGYPADAVSMGLPSWLASWGVSSGRGASALAHVQEIALDLPSPTGIAIWDLQLTGWQDSELWCAIAALKDADAGPAVDPRLRVDQFGYVPGAKKLCVIGAAEVGFDAPSPWTPAGALEVRRSSDESVVFADAPREWRGGAVHAQSGDRAWVFDFSAVTEEGTFHVWDPGTQARSHDFEVRTGVYEDVLREAVRAFFYQRCGIAKATPHADARWEDATTCHGNAEQDADCRSASNPMPATTRDLRGGWHDAGDYNKYVNFADIAVHDLLQAYMENPGIWGDDWGLPESGDGVEDVLNEVAWELDWFLAMQEPDGSVLHKVSVTDWSAASPPSADAAPRRWAPATASATISACASWAHAAWALADHAHPAAVAMRARYLAAAVRAWGWLEANPGLIPSAFDNAGFVNAAAEDGADWQAANRTAAAAYLLAATGESAYRDHVDATYAAVHLVAWSFAYPFEIEFQDALLAYASLPEATPGVAAAIRSAYLGSVGGADHLDHVTGEDDPYQAWLSDADHTWGSNRTKAHEAVMHLQVARQGLDPANAAAHVEAAAGYLHYLHGVNPTGFVYLTNMGEHGAEASVRQLYHAWFADGTDWDVAGTSPYGPAPGIVPGGPNPSYAPDPAYAGPPLEPPLNQPILKSYRDWNTTWPENSWEVTENSITYQGAYVRLVAAFVSAAVTSPTITQQPTDQHACLDGAVTLTVAATGAPTLGHQWRRGGTPLVDGGNVAGATTDALVIDPVAGGDAGNYDCVVTDGAGGSATTGPAVLVVDDAPPASPGTSLRVRRTGDTLTLSWAAAAGATEYALLRCDAALARPCAPATLLTTAATQADDDPTALAQAWYRVVAGNGCGQTE